MEYGTLYGTAGFFMEATRNLYLNVEALKYRVMSDIVFTQENLHAKKVLPKTWRILAFADGISMTTRPYFSW
jgi:hypothetical protein